MIAAPDFIESSACCAASTASPPATAFIIAARVFRSGGLAKDAIYLRGFKAVLDLLAAGADARPLLVRQDRRRAMSPSSRSWQRGLLQPPALVPEFLAQPEAQRAIARLRDGPSLFNSI